jgi:hypothetical protein
MIDGLDTVERNLVDNLNRVGVVGVSASVEMKGMGQDRQTALLVDQFDGPLGAQARRHELSQEKSNYMAVERADFLSDDNLNPKVGSAKGIFMGPKGAFQGVMIGYGDDLNTTLGGGLNHHARRMQSIRKISV